MIQRTLKLGKDWDLQLDANGQLALTKSQDAVAQTVANRCRLFVRDASYNYDEGIAYFETALGQKVQTSLLSSELRRLALEVQGVTKVISVTVDNFEIETRTLKAKIVLLTEDSKDVVVNI